MTLFEFLWVLALGFMLGLYVSRRQAHPANFEIARRSRAPSSINLKVVALLVIVTLIAIIAWDAATRRPWERCTKLSLRDYVIKCM